MSPPEPDCTARTYPADKPTVFTTGAITARFLNPYAQIGTGEISGAGQSFACGRWSAAPGPGALAGTFLQEQAPQAGDTANLLLFRE